MISPTSNRVAAVFTRHAPSTGTVAMSLSTSSQAAEYWSRPPPPAINANRNIRGLTEANIAHDAESWVDGDLSTCLVNNVLSQTEQIATRRKVVSDPIFDRVAARRIAAGQPRCVWSWSVFSGWLELAQELVRRVNTSYRSDLLTRRHDPPGGRYHDSRPPSHYARYGAR